MWKKRRLNCEMIWKTWKKGKKTPEKRAGKPNFQLQMGAPNGIPFGIT
jgi:hypothetical protein